MRIAREPYAQPRRVSAHEGNEEAAKLHECDRIHEAGDRGEGGGQHPIAAAIANHRR